MGTNIEIYMSKKNEKIVDFDREAKKEYKSQSKSKQKSQRHHSKEFLNDFVNRGIDEDDNYDIMNEFDEPQWS